MSKLAKFFKVIAAAGDQPVIIQIRGVIGDSFDDATWTIKNTGDEVRAALAPHPIGTKMKVLCDTEGGSMQCALGIRSAFDERAEDLTFYNCGYMASSGAILPPTKSKVICPDASFVMIHKPYTDIYSANDDDIEAALAAVRAHNDVYSGIIAERIGKTKDEVLALMKVTTWWTGEQARAIGYGVAAETDDATKEAAEVSARVPQIFARYKNIPETLRQRISASATAGAPSPQPPQPNNPTPQKDMKNIINALVAAGFTIPADAEESAVLPHITALITERANLRNENNAFAAARDTRVTTLVEAAITDQIVAEGRKAGLIALGKTNEAEVVAQIGELRAAKTTAHAPRGAKPAKFVAEGATEDEINARLGEIESELENRNTRPEVRAALASEALKLRGLDKLVKPLTSTKANE